jgi:hypothetical protein
LNCSLITHMGNFTQYRPLGLYVIWTTVRVFSKGPQERRVGCLL